MTDSGAMELTLTNATWEEHDSSNKDFFVPSQEAFRNWISLIFFNFHFLSNVTDFYEVKLLIPAPLSWVNPKPTIPIVFRFRTTSNQDRQQFGLVEFNAKDFWFS